MSKMGIGHSCTNCGKYILSQNGSYEYVSSSKMYKKIVRYFCNRNCFNSFTDKLLVLYHKTQIGTPVIFRFEGDILYKGLI